MSCCGNNKYGCEFNADDEGPSQADIARFGSEDIECPDCGAGVYHDSPLCQSCGHAMTDSDLKGKGSPFAKPLLLGAVGLVTAIAFLMISIP